MKPNRTHNALHKSAFTLIEIITTVMIFSVLMIAVSMLLHNAIRLRNQAQAMTAVRETRVQAKSLLFRDLVSMVPPKDILSGWLISEYNMLGGNRQDIIEFYTTTGILSQGTFLSEVQKVVYTLVQNENEDADGEYSLMRYIYRHILTETDDTPVQNIVMNNVQGLAFEFYDGDIWQTEWNTDEQDPPMPEAVKVSVAYAERVEDENLQTLEFIVPIPTIAYPESDEEEETGTGATEDDTQQSNLNQQGGFGGGGGGGRGGAGGGQGGGGGRGGAGGGQGGGGGRGGAGGGQGGGGIGGGQ